MSGIRCNPVVEGRITSQETEQCSSYSRYTLRAIPALSQYRLFSELDCTAACLYCTAHHLTQLPTGNIQYYNHTDNIISVDNITIDCNNLTPHTHI